MKMTSDEVQVCAIYDAPTVHAPHSDGESIRNVFITFEKLCSTRGLMGASALFVQAHDAKNSEILQRCQTPVRENRLGM